MRRLGRNARALRPGRSDRLPHRAHRIQAILQPGSRNVCAPDAPSASGRGARPVLDVRGPLCGVGIPRLRQGGDAGAMLVRVTSSRQDFCGPSPSTRPRWEVAHALWHMCNKPYPGRRCPVASCLLARLPGWGWLPRAPVARSVSSQSALGPATISPDVKIVPGIPNFSRVGARPLVWREGRRQAASCGAEVGARRLSTFGAASSLNLSVANRRFGEGSGVWHNHWGVEN